MKNAYTFTRFVVVREDKAFGLETELFVGDRHQCFSWRAKKEMEETNSPNPMKIKKVTYKVTKEKGYHDSKEISREEVWL
jgi:hypothetical protein